MVISSGLVPETCADSKSDPPKTPPLSLRFQADAAPASDTCDSTPFAPKSEDNTTPTQAELADISKELKDGIVMLKVSAKKVVHRQVKLAPEVGQIFWESRTGGVLNIELVRELRFGSDARGYREALGKSQETESRWTSIIYASTVEKKIKVLHLVALNSNTFSTWRAALTSLYDQRRTLMGGLDQMRRRQNVWLRQHWRLADSTGNEQLNFPQIVTLCSRLGIVARQEELRTHFDEADEKCQGFLDFVAFQAFVRLLKRRPEIDKLFLRWSSGAESLDLAHFTTFMRRAQRSQLSNVAVGNIFRKFCDHGVDSMSSEGFASFLTSSENSVSGEASLKASHDMSRPLCEYYISSSHNTYLVGNQLKGGSTAEGYVRALQQGCRTVELDVWDGSNGQPVVYHGRTLTSKILARDVLLAIAKYAFVASPYPVILSMEVHCEAIQQKRLAQTLREVLGESLISGPLSENAELVELPSPEQLRYRFLVKAKNLHTVPAGSPVSEGPTNFEEGDASSSSASSDTSDLRAKLGTALRRFRSGSDASVSTSPSVSSQSNRKTDDNRARPATQKLSSEMAALLVYTVGVKHRGFNKKEQYAPAHVLSLGERRASRTIKESADEIIAHNRTHLMRTYPSGARFTSSNFLPHHMWAVGVQMVAMNWQTFDLGAEINAAMFQRNGKSGYVLKPEVLRIKGPLKDKQLLATPTKYILWVQVISAQQIGRARSAADLKSDQTANERTRIDPCVEMAVFAPGQHTIPRQRTSWVRGNGFNPVFDGPPLELPFEVVGGMLDLVFLRFQVLAGEPDGSAMGRSCISVGSLAPGYRHMPLYDELGTQYLFSSLFVHTRLERIS